MQGQISPKLPTSNTPSFKTSWLVLSRSIDKLPEMLSCPITLQQFVDPVVAADGITYERAAIEDWFSKVKELTSPMTGGVLKTKYVVPNVLVKSMVQEFYSL
jgi:hypothetical protein